MITRNELLAAVDAAFRTTGATCAPWQDPHPDRQPSDEEYSRVTDATKWRIVGARADAWMQAVVDLGLAEVHRDVTPRWVEPPGTVASRADVAVPHRAGALPLLIAHSRLDGVDDGGITVGVGDPAVVACWIPDCGCDACDSGSQDVLDQVDEWLSGIVLGEFRRLCRHVRRPPAPEGWRWSPAPVTGDDLAAIEAAPAIADSWALPERQEITVIDGSHRSASGGFARGEIESALADPTGWHEVSGPAWSTP